MLRLMLATGFLLGPIQQVCAQQPQQTDLAKIDTLTSIALPAALDRVLRDYEQGWRNYDAQALAALFAPDGFILRPGRHSVRGRAAIAEAYRNSGGPLQLRALSYAQADSVAYIVGEYGTTPDSPVAGKFILTLRRLSDGKWYITADMDNSSG